MKVVGKVELIDRFEEGMLNRMNHSLRQKNRDKELVYSNLSDN